MHEFLNLLFNSLSKFSMSKRTCLFVMVLFSASFAFAQDEVARHDSVGVHPWNMEKNENNYIIPEISHWSLLLHGGFNVFDGDFTSEKKHGVSAPSVGLGVMYNFNPTWGIGVDYTFRKYGVKGYDKEESAATMLDGMMHQADAFITFDIFNAWRPQNKRKIFGLDLILGGGAAWYKNSVYYKNLYRLASDGSIAVPQSFSHHTGNPDPALSGKSSDDKYTCYGVLKFGASFNFNVSRSIQLGLRGIYNMYTKDEVDGRVRGNKNDGIFDTELVLRYKIAAVKKSHVCNYNSNAVLDDWCAKQQVAKAAGTAQHSEPVVDTVYVYHKDTLYLSQIVEKTKTLYLEQDFMIYFDNGKADLDDDGWAIVHRVARELKDSDKCVSLVGFCDNTGSDARNNELSAQRANAVKDALVKNHSIDADRIIVLGQGRVSDANQSFRPNRRVDIFIIDKSEVDIFKKQYEK